MEWQTLPEMLFAQAEKYPDGLYLRFVRRGQVTRTFTYEQTCDWASAWASALRAAGVREGDVVALALQNGEDFCGAFYGALMADATPLPIPPAHRVAPDDAYWAQVVQRLTQASARALVVTPEQANMLEFGGEYGAVHVVTNQDLAAVS